MWLNITLLFLSLNTFVFASPKHLSPSSAPTTVFSKLNGFIKKYDLKNTSLEREKMSNDSLGVCAKCEQEVTELKLSIRQNIGLDIDVKNWHYEATILGGFWHLYRIVLRQFICKYNQLIKFSNKKEALLAELLELSHKLVSLHEDFHEGDLCSLISEARKKENNWILIERLLKKIYQNYLAQVRVYSFVLLDEQSKIFEELKLSLASHDSGVAFSKVFKTHLNNLWLESKKSDSELELHAFWLLIKKIADFHTYVSLDEQIRPLFPEEILKLVVEQVDNTKNCVIKFNSKVIMHLNYLFIFFFGCLEQGFLTQLPCKKVKLKKAQKFILNAELDPIHVLRSTENFECMGEFFVSAAKAQPLVLNFSEQLKKEFYRLKALALACSSQYRRSSIECLFRQVEPQMCQNLALNTLLEESENLSLQEQRKDLIKELEKCFQHNQNKIELLISPLYKQILTTVTELLFNRFRYNQTALSLPSLYVTKNHLDELCDFVTEVTHREIVHSQMGEILDQGATDVELLNIDFIVLCIVNYFPLDFGLVSGSQKTQLLSFLSIWFEGMSRIGFDQLKPILQRFSKKSYRSHVFYDVSMLGKLRACTRTDWTKAIQAINLHEAIISNNKKEIKRLYQQLQKNKILRKPVRNVEKKFLVEEKVAATNNENHLIDQNDSMSVMLADFANLSVCPESVFRLDSMAIDQPEISDLQEDKDGDSQYILDLDEITPQTEDKNDIECKNPANQAILHNLKILKNNCQRLKHCLETQALTVDELKNIMHAFFYNNNMHNYDSLDKDSNFFQNYDQFFLKRFWVFSPELTLYNPYDPVFLKEFWVYSPQLNNCELAIDDTYAYCKQTLPKGIFFTYYQKWMQYNASKSFSQQQITEEILKPILHILPETEILIAQQCDCLCPVSLLQVCSAIILTEEVGNLCEDAQGV